MMRDRFFPETKHRKAKPSVTRRWFAIGMLTLALLTT
jgi:hypothetical protein